VSGGRKNLLSSSGRKGHSGRTDATAHLETARQLSARSRPSGTTTCGETAYAHAPLSCGSRSTSSRRTTGRKTAITNLQTTGLRPCYRNQPQRRDARAQLRTGHQDLRSYFPQSNSGHGPHNSPPIVASQARRPACLSLDIRQRSPERTNQDGHYPTFAGISRHRRQYRRSIEINKQSCTRIDQTRPAGRRDHTAAGPGRVLTILEWAAGLKWVFGTTSWAAPVTTLPKLSAAVAFAFAF
jgi:hypothetical protein